jgi:hypothetical protein
MTNNALETIKRYEELEEFNESKYLNTISKAIPKKRICPPPWSYDYPIYKKLSTYIICNNNLLQCPRRWEELDLNFDDLNIRYCSFCKKNVYKVTNEYNYNKFKESCICIPNNSKFLEILSKDMLEYTEIYKFIQISRQFIQESGYLAEIDLYSNSSEDLLYSIRVFINDRIKNSNYETFEYWKIKYQKYQIQLENFLSYKVQI